MGDGKGRDRRNSNVRQFVHDTRKGRRSRRVWHRDCAKSSRCVVVSAHLCSAFPFDNPLASQAQRLDGRNVQRHYVADGVV